MFLCCLAILFCGAYWFTLIFPELDSSFLFVNINHVIIMIYHLLDLIVIQGKKTKHSFRDKNFRYQGFLNFIRAILWVISSAM